MNIKSTNILVKNSVGNSSSSDHILLVNQSAIARRLKISQGYVSLILAGKRQSRKYESRIKELVKQAAENLKAA